MALFLPVIVDEEPTRNDSALAALAEFLGIGARFVPLDQFLSGANDLAGNRGCAAVDGATLRRIAGEGTTVQFRSRFARLLTRLFVYGLAAGQTPDAALSDITGGAIRGLRRPALYHSYAVSRDSRGVCRQIGGQVIGPVECPFDYVLDTVKERPGGETLIAVDGDPLFFVAGSADCDVFVAATSEILDVTQPVFGELDAGRIFSRLLPSAMFLRAAFGNALWHSEKDQACLVVDDPLLRENYGFLNYRTLARLMDECGFATSIAFIPWNFKRTSSVLAGLIAGRPDRFSLCVHGCDHTRNEFGSLDQSRLNRLVTTAMTRMDRHKSRTGLAFDNIMVFPQGVFSTHAMKVLKANNYLAAVNAEAIPTDFHGSLPIASFLEPAITAFQNFPLFLRRWPDETAAMAIDLFWGRPILVLAHHDFFREGYSQAIAFANAVNSINTTIRWSSPGEIIRSSQLVREDGAGNVEVKGYSSEIVIANDGPTERRYLVQKDESDDTPVRVSLVSGKNIKANLAKGMLSVRLVLPPRTTEIVRVSYPGTAICADGDLPGSVRVRFRRYLSEVRDNYISRNDRLLTLATKLKDLLPV